MSSRTIHAAWPRPSSRVAIQDQWWFVGRSTQDNQAQRGRRMTPYVVSIDPAPKTTVSTRPGKSQESTSGMSSSQRRGGVKPDSIATPPATALTPRNPRTAAQIQTATGRWFTGATRVAWTDMVILLSRRSRQVAGPSAWRRRATITPGKPGGPRRAPPRPPEHDPFGAPRRPPADLPLAKDENAGRMRRYAESTAAPSGLGAAF